MQRLTTVAPTTFFAELFPFVIYRIEIVSALYISIPFKIISWNLAQIYNMTRWHAEINNIYSTCNFAELFPFVFSSIDIVSAL